jgi:threonine dehydrogenase-like Zn-dependent dehydrogenase
LIALVAKSRGGKVLVSEINPYRISLLQSLDIDVINPGNTDVLERVYADTNGRGADVVFEVTSSSTGAKLMTDVARPRGRIVVVAIFPNPAAVNLHQVFLRELQIRGTRVYEPEDFKEAIRLAASNVLPLEQVISREFPLEHLGDAIDCLKSGGQVMKVLIHV